MYPFVLNMRLFNATNPRITILETDRAKASNAFPQIIHHSSYSTAEI